MNETHRMLPVMGIDAEVRAATVNEKARTAEVIFTTGSKVRRRRMFSEEYDEQLEVSPATIRLERLNAGAPFLDTHDAFQLSSILGVVVEGSARIEKGRGVATIKFSDREDVEPVFRDVKNGIIRNVSVGYRVHKYEIEKRDGEIDLWRAVDWEPLEISAVPIGADPGAHVREDDALHKCVLELRGDATSEQRTLTQGKKPMPDGNAPTAAAIQTRDNQDSCKSLIDNLVKRHDLGDDFAKKHTDCKSTAAQVRTAALEEIAKRDNADIGQSQLSDPACDLTIDNPLFRQRAMAGSIFQQMMPQAKAPPEAEAYRGFGFVDLARDDLERRGFSVRGMRPASIIRTVLEHRSTNSTRAYVGYGATGSGDFVTAVGDSGRMLLLERYRRTPPALKAVASQMNFPDYRPQKSVRGSGFPELKETNEHGEITHGTLVDSGEDIVLKRYARIVALTHQLLVNDAVGEFTDLMTNAAEAALAVEANVLAAAVETNPALSDGNNIFSTAHNNIAAVGAPPDETTLSAGRSTMRQQTGLNKELIAPTPAMFIVPTELETTAEKLVAMIQPTKTADANVFSSLGVLVEPRLADPTAWYLSASPEEVAGLRYGYLDSEDGPLVDERSGWETDGIEVRVRLSFGAGFVDHRGWYKNDGV
jgi:prohead serine protease